MCHDPDAVYHAARASAEAVRAIGATSEAAAAIHQELCLRYTGRLLAGLVLGAATSPSHPAAADPDAASARPGTG